MRKSVKEILNVLQNHSYSINNIICDVIKASSLKHYTGKLAFKNCRVTVLLKSSRLC